MLKLVVSGAKGFVGHNVIKYLLDGSNNCIEPLKSFNISPNLFKSYLDNFHVIIHFAGKSHDIKKVSSPDEYYQVNTELTKQIFDAFMASNAKVFITLSSVKAVADEVHGMLTEEDIPSPITHYGKSKLLAEQYILSRDIPEGKKVYVLRPCMIHGLGNKGNLNLLYNFASKGLPWPLGNFKNRRSYCSIENLCFIIKELINRSDIPSGIYNVSDDEPISTNQVVSLIAESKGKPAWVMNLSKSFIRAIARSGDFLQLSFNTESLQKLTESYVVSNHKIKRALGKSLPLTSLEGLRKTFRSFSSNA
jgi:nucleoside-diphosphate-sugar epimerase